MPPPNRCSNDLEACLSGPDWLGELQQLRDLIEDIEYDARAVLERMRRLLTST
jgi:hypothetical protein